jgi:hypothetical protein
VGLHQKEIRKIGSRNTGLIEIIPSNDVHSRNTVAVDEVLINSRVYRVPERVIILDFWGSVRNRTGEQRSRYVDLFDYSIANMLINCKRS